MKFLRDVIKGVIIGIANAIPGVSGGTMMVSMGIYDDIIYSITHLFKQLKKSVLILLPYILGMIVGIVGLAFAITFLDTNYPFQTRMVFVGLILGGVPLLFQKLKKHKLGVSNGIIFLLFFLAIIFMQYFGEDTADVTLTIGFLPLVKIFVIGIIASATMVIPGVSGSMMLMILGYYNPIMNAVTEVITEVTKGEWNRVLEIGASLLPFGLGVVVGIFAIAKMIEILLANWEGLTYSAILGLVISSPVVILMGTELSGLGSVTILTGLLALLCGGAVAYKLGGN